MYTLTVNTNTLMEQIAAVWLMESGSSRPTPPKGAMEMYINEANARLLVILDRFVDPGYDCDASNAPGLKTALKYELNLSTRRGAGKAHSLAAAFDSYLRNDALAALYADAQLPELSTKHSRQSAADGQLITVLLHSKLPPL